MSNKYRLSNTPINFYSSRTQTGRLKYGCRQMITLDSKVGALNPPGEKMFTSQQSLPNLINYGVLSVLVLALTGCLAAPIKPSTTDLQKIHSFLVMPVESPPLEVIPDLIETRSPVYGQFAYRTMPVSTLLEKKIYRNPGGVAIAGYVGNDDSMPIADSHPALDSTHLEPVASAQNNWSPTLALAQEAVSQLEKKQVKAVISDHYYPLPIAEKDRDATPGNWHNAIGQWYNQDISSVDYRRLAPEHVDAVLEVGIGNYRIFDAQTSLQVLVKLVNPNTRQVIGRISAKTYSVEDSPQTLLDHDAEKFKQLVTLMGAQLITQDFNELGLPLNMPVQSTVADSPHDRRLR